MMKGKNNKSGGGMTIGQVMEKMSPEAVGALMAFLLAVLRVLGEKDSNQMSWRRAYRIVIEGLTCSALALAASPAIVVFDFDPKMNILLGTFIGFVGSQVIRIAAVSVLNKKVK